MRKLIFFCGRMDSPFFQNEIRILKKHFDEIYVVSYPMSNEKFQEILNKNDIRGYLVPQYRFSISVAAHCLKWIFLQHVRDEVRIRGSLSAHGLKRLLYMLFYVFFVAKAYDIVMDELERNADDYDIYLYAFWLSRPSYVAAFVKWLHPDRVIKAVSRAHGYDLYEEREELGYLPFRRFISSNIDEIHFVSEDGKRYFENKLSHEYHITNKPDLWVDYLGTHNKHGYKKEIKDKQEIVIASCAFVSYVKRLDLIIDFLVQMKGMSVRWIHVGDGKLLDSIKVLANDRIPYINVCFYGNVDNSKILSLYEREDVDFFINLSDSEGLPVSIMEAMSMGIPVIARSVGGIGEIIHNENGCLLDGIGICEKERVRQFLEMRMEKPEEYQIFSENAFRTWKEKFDADVNYDRFCKRMING